MDRVAMLLAGVDTIKEVILFPTLRPESMARPESIRIGHLLGEPVAATPDDEEPS
jgi:hypothetical protein